MSEKNEETKTQALALITSTADVMYLAKCAAQSGLFGTTNVTQVFTLMSVAHADGIHPMHAMRRYHIIQDKPAMKAEAMLADFQRSGGKVEWLEHSATEVKGTFSHPQGGTITHGWTIEQAEAAGLTKNPTWKKYPENMLHARTVSDAVRFVYPQACQGFYTPEEIIDMKASPVVTEKDKAEAIDIPGDNRPKADRLADKLGGTATVPATPDVLNATDIEHEDIPAPAAPETIDTERDSLLDAIITLRDSIGREEYIKVLKAGDFKTAKTSEMDNSVLEDLLTALEKREQEIKHAAFVQGAGAPPAQAKGGESLEHVDMRKKFFAVAKERFGKGFDHHEIIGESCSLSEMSTEDIERAILMIEAGEFDYLKNNA
jgi:hypothetical protein